MSTTPRETAFLGCGFPFQGAYAASKAAATSLTESLRVEIAPFGIRVVNLITGAIKSTFFTNTNSVFNPELPADSIYNVPKETIEGHMACIENTEGRTNAET